MADDRALSAHDSTLSHEKALDIIIDVDEYFEEGSFPDHMLNKDNFKYSITTRPIVALTEPLHIGLANIAANFARIARLRKPGIGGGLKALWAGLTAFSLKRATIKARILESVSVISPTAEVHPTAVIEGSVIGSGAKIGAYAVVRFSVVGERAFIDDHAAIKFSTIGDRAYISNNNVIFFCTVYPGAFLISGPYHFSCFGKDSAIMNSIPTDYRLDGKTIKIKTKHGVQDTGLRFAGSIIGHRTRIAAGLIFSPGTSIPGDLTLYTDPARVCSRIDPDLAKKGNVWFLKDGKLTDEFLKKEK
jgi:carbonic anhydrase/acetyltransferase-like protein (isoleucine patch superfamily)